MAQDFARFIRQNERGLIGFLYFAALDAARAEELFVDTCQALRRRWHTLKPDEREGAAFEIAANLTRSADISRKANDELSRELARLSPAARIALCLDTFGPKPRESALGRRMLRQAPAPSAARQMRGLRTTPKSLLAVAISLVMCLALVAGFGALHGSYRHPPATLPADWLGDEIRASLAQASDTTFGPGALIKPASGETEKLAGINAGFDILTPAKLPEGYYLKAARVFEADKTGLGFTVVRLIYTDDDTELTLLEAEGGFPWLTDFVSREERHVTNVQKHGTAVLLISRHFTDDALRELAASLKPR